MGIDNQLPRKLTPDELEHALPQPGMKRRRIITTPNRITDTVDALADHIAEESLIAFGDLPHFPEWWGINTAGDEELTGEHVNQARVHESTMLIGSVSDEYVRIVESLFKTRPVTLMIDDPASSIGDEPWRVCWTGHRDALVDAATELVRSRGAITLMDLYDELDFRGAPVHGDLSMMLGRHAVGNGDVRTQPVNPKNVVLWNCGTTGLLTIIELMSTREPQVVLERTSVEYYRLRGMVLLEDYTDDGRPEISLPVVDFGDELAVGGYESPT